MDFSLIAIYLHFKFDGSALSAPNVREFLARRYEAALESISSQARNVLMLWERFKKKNN